MNLGLWLFSLEHDGVRDWFWWVTAWICWLAGIAFTVGVPLVLALSHLVR